MKYNRFVAPIMAGFLTLTLGLAGCGGNNAKPAETTAEETTETTTEATTEKPAETTTEEATAEESKIIFWQGETEKGDTLMYSEEEENDTATIILFGNHEGEEELLAYSGPVTADETNGTITISDTETGDSFSFQITGATEDALTIDLGEHGNGTLKPVTEKEFEEDINSILEVVTAVGDQLNSLEDQDVEELFNILGALLAE